MTEVTFHGTVVHKFALVVDDEQTIRIQKGAKVLDVQEQYGQPVLWAVVDLSAPVRDVQISTRGTGHSVLGTGEYLGTYQMLGGTFVGHVFLAAGEEL